MQTWKKISGVVLVVGMVAGAYVLGRGQQSGDATPESSETTTTVPGQLPETTLASVMLDADLPKNMQLPGGGDDSLFSAGATQQQVDALTKALNITGVKKDADGWKGGGLTVKADGTWAYENPSVKDVSPADCSSVEPCDARSKTVPGVEGLPTNDEAVAQATSIVVGTNLTIRPKRAERSDWRVEVYLTGFYENVNVNIDGHVWFGSGGAVISASGVLGEWGRAQTMVMKSSLEAYGELALNGVLVEKGGRVPAQGEKIVVSGVYRLSEVKPNEKGGLRTIPGWAFRDTQNNVWWVGTTEVMEGVVVGEEPEGTVSGGPVSTGPVTSRAGAVNGATTSVPNEVEGAPSRGQG